MKKCVVCGKPLPSGNTRCCSLECKKEYGFIKKPIITRICKRCSKGFETRDSKQNYCCRNCAKQRYETQDSYDRSYTLETAYFIKLWHSQGDSLQHIAIALGRSLENVKKAFEGDEGL